MKLIEPTIEYDKQIQAYKNECVLAGSPMDGTGSFMRYETTVQWLDKVNAYKNPETVPEGMVQATQFIYVREEDEKNGRDRNSIISELESNSNESILK